MPYVHSVTRRLAQFPQRSAGLAAARVAQRPNLLHHVPSRPLQCASGRRSFRGKHLQRFASEITELRALGFAEGLSMHSGDHSSDVVVRLESGRIGVAVEFRGHASSPRYAVKPLLAEAAPDLPVFADEWTDIVQDLRKRAPLSDHD